MLLISVAALVGVFITYLIVENVLTREALVTEAAYYWDYLGNDPDHPLPNVRNMMGYKAVGEDFSAVPEALRGLEPGFGKAKTMDGEPLVYVSQRGDQTLYLVFAEAQVADLVFYFGLAPLAPCRQRRRLAADSGVTRRRQSLPDMPPIRSCR